MSAQLNNYEFQAAFYQRRKEEQARLRATLLEYENGWAVYASFGVCFVAGVAFIVWAFVK